MIQFAITTLVVLKASAKPWIAVKNRNSFICLWDIKVWFFFHNSSCTKTVHCIQRDFLKWHWNWKPANFLKHFKAKNQNLEIQSFSRFVHLCNYFCYMDASYFSSSIFKTNHGCLDCSLLHNAPYSNRYKRENRQSNEKIKIFVLSLVRFIHFIDFISLIGTSYLPKFQKRAVTNLKNYSTKKEQNFC